MAVFQWLFGIDDDKEYTDMFKEPDPQSPPHVHEWGLWEVMAEGVISTGHRDTGRYLDQKRKCVTCGKYELDTQKSSIDDD